MVECARLPHIKLRKMASLISLPHHLNVSIYSNGVLEEETVQWDNNSTNTTCRTRTTCSNNNNISKLLYCWCYETICLDWFYHFYCTYAPRFHPIPSHAIPCHPIFPLSQSIVSQAFSHSKCVCVYITNDNRLHFQTFTTFFILMVRVHVRIICMSMYACVRVCACVFMDEFVCFFALIDNRWLCFDVRKKKWNAF